MSKKISSPVLVIGYRRPDLTKNLIDAIRIARPPAVFFAVDGARQEIPGEIRLVDQVRALEVDFDWDCHVERRFLERNAGCGTAVPQAISWFFDHVDEGIILEDDLIPSQTFFTFVDDLLKRYRDEKQVWAISGSNPHGVRFRAGADYGFVTLSSIWGWATWADRWRRHDRDLEEWKQQRGLAFRRRPLIPAPHFFALGSELDLLSVSARPHTWDFQVSWSTVRDGGLWAMPQKNLVRNNGFDSRATHTVGRQPNASLEAHEGGPFRHPAEVAQDLMADRQLLWRAYRVTGIFALDWCFLQIKRLRKKSLAWLGRVA